MTCPASQRRRRGGCFERRRIAVRPHLGRHARRATFQLVDFVVAEVGEISDALRPVFDVHPAVVVKHLTHLLQISHDTAPHLALASRGLAYTAAVPFEAAVAPNTPSNTSAWRRLPARSPPECDSLCPLENSAASPGAPNISLCSSCPFWSR